MKYTLLEAVQLILSAMDSDEVNSISDTTESQQVALILKSVYYDIATDLGLTELETIFQLTASGDSSKPVIMTVPDNVMTLRSVKYNTKLSTETVPAYLEIKYVPFDMFLQQQQGISASDLTGGTAGVMTFTQDGNSYTIPYLKDRMPQSFTTFDDTTLIFNALDLTQDTTLQASKTLCLGPTYPTFSSTDSFRPDMDAPEFSLWINKAKARAFKELKQQDNQEAASETRRQKIIVQKRKRTTPDQPEVFKTPSRYGRK